jgi:hypothetical protein
MLAVALSSLTTFGASACSNEESSPTTTTSNAASAPVTTTASATASDTAGPTTTLATTTSSEPTTEPPGTDSAPPSDTGLVASSAVISAQDPTTRSEHNVEYPVITSGPKATPAINAAIKAETQDQVAAWIATVEEIAQEPGALPDGVSLYFESSTMSITSPTPDLVVWVAEGDQYLGGAHGAPFVTAQVFSGLTGQTFMFEDLISLDALPVIAEEAERQLTTYMAENDSTLSGLDPDGWAANVDNYRNFWPQADGMHFQFASYQVGPYAIGMPAITVPWDSLVDFIDADSPLIPLIETT